MSDFIDFIDFLFWFLKTFFFLVGFAFGAVVCLLATPFVFRAHRRRALRRQWKADKPRTVTEGLFPEWQNYDPDIPGIARRCVCHGRRVHPGERVLTWPETGPMNLLHVAVYCESVKERLWHEL